MKRTLLLLLLVVAIIAVAPGCNAPVPGMRWAASEPERQSAQVADDVAGGVKYIGLRPGSPAARTLANSTGPLRTRAGEPKQPIDVEDLIEAEAGAWELKDDQITAWKLKENLSARAGQITSRALADLAKNLQIKGKVATSEIVQRVESIVNFYRMSAELTQAIDVPADKQISDAEQAHLDALTNAAREVADVARKLADRDVTAGDVGDRIVDELETASDKAEEWSDRVLDVATRWESILVSLGVVGGGGLMLRRRGKKKQAEKNQAINADAAANNAVLAEAIRLLGQSTPPVTAETETTTDENV